MKVKYIITLLIITVFISNSWAVNQIGLLQSDITQKKYERKAVLGLDLGFPTRRIKVPVYYCPPKQKCRPVDTWIYTIDQRFENKIAKELYSWLITQRFDKVVITPSKAYIITATKTIGIDTNTMSTFSFDVGTYNSFKRSLENYLNNKLSPIVSKLMSSALEQRYKELPEREQETFITQKAKELGIPVEIAKKLMNSAFVFGVYFQPVKPIAKFSKKIIRTIYGYKTIYPTTIEIPIKIKLIIFKFDADKKRFVLYKELKGFSGWGITEKYEYDHFPASMDTGILFEKCVLASAKSTGVNLNTILKEDKNFAIFATVDEVSGTTVKSDIGVLEDLRIDAPYLVKEYINGQPKVVGFVKARKVFVNCEKRGYSKFQLIKGKAELKDQLQEYPWTGILSYIGGGVENYEVTSFDGYDLSSGGGTFTTFKLGFTLDLGYILNNHSFSEIWLDLNGGIGFGGKALKREKDNSDFTDSPIYYSLGLGIYKRIYLSNLGFYISPGLELVGQRFSTSGNGYYYANDAKINVDSLSLIPGIHLGYNFSPDLELVGYVGWNFPIATEGSIDDVSIDAEVSGGLIAGLFLKYHIKIVGSFGKLYQRPSNICRSIAKKEK